jgi:hypothetical protein
MPTKSGTPRSLFATAAPTRTSTPVNNSTDKTPR